MLALLLPLLLAQAPAPVDIDAKWAKNIATIEERLKKSPPKEGGVMFAGSSTIVRWDLNKYFPDRGYTNVGFGGSKIAECTHFAPRILQPFKPGIVVMSCGGNDLADAKNVTTPEQLAENFQAFVAAVRKTSPKCKVIFYSLKPTIRREALWDKEQKANSLIKAICEKGENLVFIDLAADLLGTDGKAKPEMLVEDKLHPSHEAYLVMAKRLNEVLEKK